MKSDWREVLSVDYLNSINYWTKYKELQKVIPYHYENYKQIIESNGGMESSIKIFSKQKKSMNLIR